MHGRYWDVKWLRDRHTMVHYFGLGFIQLKLDDVERMHFYIPGLDPIVSPEDVHNHRYGFSSYILQGRLTQELFTVSPSIDGRYEIEDVTCAEGETPTRHPGFFSLKLDSVHTYEVGGYYSIGAEQYHRVTRGAAGCITLLRRDVPTKDRAQVVRPVGSPKICPFARKIPECELWEHITEALR